LFKLVDPLLKQCQLDLAFFFNFGILPYPFVELVLGGSQGLLKIVEFLCMGLYYVDPLIFGES